MMLLESGFAANQRAITWFLPVINKPPASDEVFSIQTASVSQCRYACIHNSECLVVLHNGNQSQCTGYRKDTEGTPIIGGVKGWKLHPAGSLTILHLIERLIDK